jgi:hypothetical protein
MSGETDLNKLLASLSPKPMPGEYVFASFPDAAYGDHAALSPIAAFTESEGLTLVLPKQKADQHNVHYDAVFCGITLEVHSSLEAVGMTAAFARKLTEHGLSANVIAGFYHDHIFVPAADKNRALSALGEFN